MALEPLDGVAQGKVGVGNERLLDRRFRRRGVMRVGIIDRKNRSVTTASVDEHRGTLHEVA